MEKIMKGLKLAGLLCIGMALLSTFLVSAFAHAQPMPQQRTVVFLPVVSNAGRSLSGTIDAVRNALLLRAQVEHISAGAELSAQEDASVETVALAVTQDAPDAQVMSDDNSALFVTSSGRIVDVPTTTAGSLILAPLAIQTPQLLLINGELVAEEASATVQETSNPPIAQSKQQISVTIATESPTASVGVITEEGWVVYQNTATDVDTVVQPMIYGGARLLTIIYSAAAPQTYAFPMNLPPDAQLIVEGEGVSVLNADGDHILSITVPWAYDQTGTAVPVYYTIEGQTLIMHVAHQGFHYPVVADPTYGGIKMNDAEWGYCRWPWNWSRCVVANSNANTALGDTQYAFPRHKLYNDEADAFRHCYWNGLMTISMGSSEARGFGDRHEDFSGNDAKEKDMDLFNNGKGRDYANSIAWWSRTKTTQAFNKCYWGAVSYDLRVLTRFGRGRW